MNNWSTARDLTHSVRLASPVAPALLLFMCDHKGGRLGAQMRGRIPWRCAACVAKRAAA